MPLPTPKIDSRTFDVLVRETLGLAPRYSRSWARPQKQDPGHALTEVFGAINEMILERLNRFPDKVFAELLDLIGMRLRLPIPARSLARFELSREREEGTWVPAGTRVGTIDGPDGEPIVFETERDVFVFESQLCAVYSRHRDLWAEHQGADQGFQPFADLQPVEDWLVIDDPRIDALRGKCDLKLYLECPKTKGGDVRDFLSWEIGDPVTGWQPVATSRLDDPQRPDDKLVVVQGPIEGLQNPGGWQTQPPSLRARISGRSAFPEAVEVARLSLSVGANARGVRPSQALTSLGDGFFAVIDQASHFQPFGPRPKLGVALYLLAEACLDTPDSRIEIEFNLSDSPSVKTPRPSLDLIVVYEYFNGSDWIGLGATTPFGAKGTYLPHLFTDETRALSRDGKVGFNRPADIRSLAVRGIEGRWIRARISQGDYGSRDEAERPLRPPVLRRIRVRQQQVPGPAAQVGFCHDFQREDWSEKLTEGAAGLRMLRPRPQLPPLLVFGFDPKPAAKPLAMFFALDQVFHELEASAPNGGLEVEGQRVVWEYHNGRDWSPLFPRDNLDMFTRSGCVEFMVPYDLAEVEQFGRRASWVRARFAGMGSRQPAVPRVLSISTNAVEIQHRRTERKVLLGAGDGTPHQLLRFPKTPVLAQPRLWVLEAQAPSEQQARAILQESGALAIKVDPDDPERGTWVLWREVKTFADSGTSSRHFLLDHLKGTVVFGDGQRGLCPANGDEVVVEYHLGGGLEGNVALASISELQDAVPYIEAVSNPWQGMGGLPLGDLREVMQSGPQLIKNRQRAVTGEDYEWLVREQFGEVARVRCFDDPTREGRVEVTVIPAPLAEDLAAKLLPSAQLVKTIRDHLAARCQIALTLDIGPARFVDIEVQLVMALKVGGARVERVKAHIETCVRRFLHATRGGPHGNGWPFGRSLMPSDVLKSLEAVAEIDFIADLRMQRAGKRVPKIVLQARELIHIAAFDIVEVMGR